VAYVPSLITIVLIYYWLFRLSFSLYKKSPLGFAALVVFLSPFAIALTQVRSMLELMWVLLLTPAYSVIVMSLLFTNWIIRYYCLAFATLALLQFAIQRRNARNAPVGKTVNYQAFWKQRTTRSIQTNNIKSKLNRLRTKWKFHPLERAKTHRSLIVAIALLAVLATTLVSSTEVRNPTYDEAMQFVASDKTHQNQYIEKTYTCGNFATDFRNNALKAGFECGSVIVFFSDNSSHELNCFNTTDQGTIFIEPQSNEIVTLTKGELYWGTITPAQPTNVTITGYYINR
jgi:hypothetical protein